MVEFKAAPHEQSFQVISATDEDLHKIEPSALRHMAFLIFLIREFETQLLDLKDLDQVHGPVHSSIGQEGIAAGVMQTLAVEDKIASTHRGHHHFLAKACNAYAGSSFDPRDGIPQEVFEVTKKTLAEILGLAEGFCRGRGGSMHLGDRTSGCIGTNAIVAGGVPCTAGVAWAFKMDRKDRITVSFLGDGAANQGSVHETMNMAALWKIPIVFFVENNLYAVATHVKNSASVDHIAQRGSAYGIPAYIIDGMDPVAAYFAMKRAREDIRNTGGPVLIEAKTYRFRHQAQSLPGSAFGYRTKEEEDEWLERDPFLRFPEKLVRREVLTQEEADSFREAAEKIVRDAVESLTESGPSGPRVRDELFPDESELMVGIRSTGEEFSGVRFVEKDSFASMKNRKMIDVIPEVLLRRMDAEPGTVILGEEVASMKGGAFMATKGIYRTYPERVINTPISECGFTGMALGLALEGKRPVVEIMYPDFSLAAADQLFNQIGKFRYMYGNQYDIPLICRTRVGIGSGYGAQHSMEPATLFALFPGWRILAPSNPFDYIGLFNSAFRSNDPVLVIEHAMLYQAEGQVPEDRDYFVQMGKASVPRMGSDITLVAYSFMVRKALEAAEQLEQQGISAEVIDLRTVDYANIDYDAIGTSLSRTGRIVFLEEGLSCGGIGAQLSDETQRRFFDYLDAEIGRVAGKPLPVPVSRIPERRAIPQIADILREVNFVMRGRR